MKIPPFNPDAPDVKSCVEHIMKCKPVQNLTEDEVLQTLRLLQLHTLLIDKQRTTHFSVTVYQDDHRLQSCTDEDKFMALLLDAEVRGLILMTKRLHYCFGGTHYKWRNVAKRLSIITTSSMTMNGDYGGKFFGRGWVIAPNIKTLRRWIVEHSTNPEINSLKV